MGAWLDLPASLLEALRDTIGLENPDPGDPLHVKLVKAMRDTTSYSTLGQRIVAMRFVINWEHRQAGSDYATAKSEYEKAFTKARVRLLAEDGMSVARAELLAADAEDVYELKLAFLMAEQRERSMRLFLQSLDRALDNHRTDRADWRGADQAHAHGYSGGA